MHYTFSKIFPFLTSSLLIRHCARMLHRLLLSDPLRIKSRDDKLWVRDKKRAKLYGLSRLPCPCHIHRGVGVPYKLEEIEKHLYRHGRSPDCRTWGGPDNPDSSDEEWENDFSAKNKAASRREPERDNGLEMRQMMHDMYQQVEAFAQAEEQLNEETMNALDTSDHILGVNMEDAEGDANQGGQPGANVEANAGYEDNAQGNQEQYLNTDKLEEERMKDVKALEDAMRNLFAGSTNSNLGATVMLVNLVATHPGITEKAADDIFATMKCLLPTDNNLPGSLYQAKALTNRLGLGFRNIDGCPNGCVLFHEPNKKDLDRCPACKALRYKDMFHRTRPLKVLRYFRLTPRFQRFFRIPVLSKLMRWHKENESSDGKVRYPADSVAWKSLDTMDPAVCDTSGFGSKVTDVRVQISCDSICPFKLHKSTWSAWPVLATNPLG